MTERAEPRPGDAPHPVLRAMLICDYTIRDAETGKVSIIEIFADVQAMDFPVLHPALCVYVNVDDAEGKYLMRLDLVRVEDETRLGSGEMQVEVGDRMRPTELVFELRNIVFDRPGAYQFRVVANDRHVGAKTFRVVDLKPGGRT